MSYFGPLYYQKLKVAFHPISSYQFVRRIARVKNFGMYFTFTGCYGNQNGQQNRLEIEKLPFKAKFEAFGDRFFKN